MKSEINPDDLIQILEKLGSSNRLDKDKAITNWGNALKDIPPEVLKPKFVELAPKIFAMFESKKWEERYGALYASTHLISVLNVDDQETLSFKSKLFDLLKSLMKDSEYRIRVETGECLKMLIEKYGIVIYKEIKPYLLQLFEEYNNIKEQPEDEKKKSSTLRHLESTIIILEKCIEGAKESFLPFVDESLFSLIDKVANHEAHFIREIGLGLFKELLKALGMANFHLIGPRFSGLIYKGMSDDWPNIRYTGCITAKEFANLIANNDELKKTYYPMLLPAICLNRYYNVEGVKNCALQTWKDIVGDKGREYVLEYLDYFIKYYITQTKTKSLIVREAACHCIAEIYTKVAVLCKEKVKPFMENLLNVLLESMKDMSWEVRNAACIAGSKLILVNCN